MYKCDGCFKEAEELCGGLMCRECHVSLTFEDCVDGTYSVGVLLKEKSHSNEDLKEIYPDAKQWKQ